VALVARKLAACSCRHLRWASLFLGWAQSKEAPKVAQRMRAEIRAARSFNCFRLAHR